MHVFWQNCIHVHLSAEGKMSIYTTPPSEIQLKKTVHMSGMPSPSMGTSACALSIHDCQPQGFQENPCLYLEGRQKRQVSLGTSVCFKCVDPNPIQAGRNLSVSL